jgi:hypothetical protein
MHAVQRTTLNCGKQSSALCGAIIAVIMSITGAVTPISAATRTAVTTQTLYGDAVTIDAANPTSQVIPESINNSGNMLAREIPESGDQYPAVITISGVGSSATISQTLPQSPPTQSSFLVPGEPRVVGITDSGSTYGTISICPAIGALCFFHAGEWSPAGGQPTDLGFGGVLSVNSGGSFGGFYGVDTGKNNGAEKYTCGAFLNSGSGSIGFLAGTSSECDFPGTNGPYGDYGTNEPAWNQEVIAATNSGMGMLIANSDFVTTAGATLANYEEPDNPATYEQLMSDTGIIIGHQGVNGVGGPEGATWNARTGVRTKLPGVSVSQPDAEPLAITASGTIVGDDDLGAALWTSPTAAPIQLADVGGPVLISGNGKYLVTAPPFGGGNDYLRYTRLDAPVVRSVGPTDGPAKGAQTIHVTGTNFKGATAINFELPDATQIPATSFSCQTTSCTVVTPDMSAHVAIARSHGQTRGQSRRDNGTPGELLTNVRVTTDGGTSAVVAADQFTFSKVTVTNISANHGVLDQSGSSAPSIVISGTGFKQGKTNVFFVSQQGPSILSETPTSVVWDSSTQLTVRLGHNVGQDLPRASDAASYPTNVIVHVGSDYAPVTPKDVYTFLPPTISALSLRHVTMNVSKPLTITGSDFVGVTDVVGVCLPEGRIKSPRHPLYKFNVASSSTITAKTLPFADTMLAVDGCTHGEPAEATYPFDIQIEVGHTYSPPVPADLFTYDGPVIQSVSSTAKPYLNARATVTIKGTGLDNVDKVTLANPGNLGNGELVGNDLFTGHSSTSIVFPAPTMSATLPLGGPFTQVSYPYTLHVTVGYAVDPGRTTNFNFLGPQLTSVTPTSGALAGGKPITIRGNGFQHATRVFFRLASDPSHATSLTSSQFKVSTDGRTLTITKAPNLTSLIPAQATGTQTFAIAVDLDNTETPATSADQYSVP